MRAAGCAWRPPGDQIEFEDIDDPALRVRDGVLEFLDTPHRPKFVMDAAKGWLAYISKDDQLFIKTFPVEPEGYYGDVAGNNVSVWYYKDKVVEIEPMSPWKTIPPGNCYSFTENWYLYDYPYPDDKKADLDKVRKLINP